MSAKGSELKRVRQSRKRNLRNKQYKSQLRTALKNVLTAGSKEEAENILPSSLSIFDKVARKGIIHKNKAANQKSRMMRHIASL